MKQTYVNVSFFRCFTLSPNVSSVHQQIQQKTTNQTEAKANRIFWTPSAVFARVCYGCGPTTLGCSGFKDVGLRLGCVCFSKSVQACNWNKLHTPHSKHGSIGKCFEGQVIKYHPNDMQFFMWVSLFVLLPLCYVQRFTSSLNSRNQKSPKPNHLKVPVTSFTKRFVCPQNWN